MRMLEFVGVWMLGQAALLARAADGGDDLPNWADMLIRLGSYGALLALVWWLVRVLIPQDREAAKQDREALHRENAANRESFQKAVAAFQEQLNDARRQNAAMEQRMAQRDQQMASLLRTYGCQDLDCTDRKQKG